MVLKLVAMVGKQRLQVLLCVVEVTSLEGLLGNLYLCRRAVVSLSKSNMCLSIVDCKMVVRF